jgi:acetolactate synthase-1/2/3 large subunit
VTGVGALAAAIRGTGTTTVFGLVGDGNVALVDELVDRHGIHYVATRHEHAAVAAADGYARRVGRTGVATVTHGPGLAQTASALRTAVAARSPVVVLAGAVDPAARRHAQRFDQPAFVAACGATHLRVRTADSITVDIADAWRSSGEGPVVIDLPLDLQRADVPAAAAPGTSAAPGSADPAALPAPSGEPDPDVVARAADLLATSRRPLVLLGRGAVLADAGPAARALADHVGALVGTTLPVHGWLADHPRHVGVIGGFATPAARSLIRDCDVVVALGASLTRFTFDHGRMFPRAAVIHVDRDRRAIGDPVPATVALVADARRAAEALRTTVPVSAGWPQADVARALVAEPDDKPGPTRDDGPDPRAVLDALDLALPARRAVVVGVGHYSGWASLRLRVHPITGRCLPWEFGAVGVALGAALGVAAAGADELVVCIEGDGGVLMSLPELETLARERLPVLVAVLDDRGYGAEAHVLRASGRAPAVAHLPTPDLVSVAAGLGLPAARADTPDDLPDAVARVLGKGPPGLLHLPVSRQPVHDAVFAALRP